MLKVGQKIFLVVCFLAIAIYLASQSFRDGEIIDRAQLVLAVLLAVIAIVVAIFPKPISLNPDPPPSWPDPGDRTDFHLPPR